MASRIKQKRREENIMAWHIAAAKINIEISWRHQRISIVACNGEAWQQQQRVIARRELIISIIRRQHIARNINVKAMAASSKIISGVNQQAAAARQRHRKRRQQQRMAAENQWQRRLIKRISNYQQHQYKRHGISAHVTKMASISSVTTAFNSVVLTFSVICCLSFA